MIDRYLARTPCLVAALLVFSSGFLFGCAGPAAQLRPDKLHHTASGFQNLPGGLEKPGFLDFLQWQSDRLVTRQSPQDASKVPRVATDLRILQGARSGVHMTWLGHSSIHLQIDGLQILMDPVLSGRASPFASFGPVAYNAPLLTVTDLPRIDLVLISHNHYDHLDERTVRALAAQAGGPPDFIVPLGVERTLQSWGVNTARAMDWYEALTVPLPLRQAESLTLEMIPAHHWSRRSLWDTNKTLWAGFRLQTKDFHVVYTGDTGYSTIYKYMSRSWPPIDWLLVPVGCYEPRWFMRAQHVNPAEAQQITQDLGARQALGVHWGVFRLCDEPVEQPLIDLHEAQKQLPVGATRIQMWAIGESRTLLSR